jgi:hypothetical protein
MKEKRSRTSSSISILEDRIFIEIYSHFRLVSVACVVLRFAGRVTILIQYN